MNVNRNRRVDQWPGTGGLRWTLVLAVAGLGVVWAVLIAVVFAAALACLAYLRADALALSALGARPMADGEMPHLENLVSGLVVANGFRMPVLHVVNDAAPNAAAVGRHPKHSALVVTSGWVSTAQGDVMGGLVGVVLFGGLAWACFDSARSRLAPRD